MPTVVGVIVKKDIVYERSESDSEEYTGSEGIGVGGGVDAD
jgi:hypothetical protein